MLIDGSEATSRSVLKRVKQHFNSSYGVVPSRTYTSVHFNSRSNQLSTSHTAAPHLPPRPIGCHPLSTDSTSSPPHRPHALARTSRQLRTLVSGQPYYFLHSRSLKRKREREQSEGNNLNKRLHTASQQLTHSRLPSCRLLRPSNPCRRPSPHCLTPAGRTSLLSCCRSSSATHRSALCCISHSSTVDCISCC